MDPVSLHHHSMPLVDSPLYQRYHKAVRIRFGKASDYVCWLCDEDAFEWAWIHDTDPSDTDHYIPLCRICHRGYDRAEWLAKERERRSATPQGRGWSPERRRKASEATRAQWANGNLNRTEQAERARRDRPWEGRRPKNGGGAR